MEAFLNHETKKSEIEFHNKGTKGTKPAAKRKKSNLKLTET